MQPTVPHPAKYKEGAGWKDAEPRDQIAKGDWYRVFGDSKLNELEAEATQSNQTLKAAFERVEEARSTARESAAQFYPTLNTQPYANRSRISPNNGEQHSLSSKPAAHTYNEFYVPFDLSYELDLWGRVRRTFESSEASAQASLADYENVWLGLKSDLAVDYFTLRTLDSQIDVEKASIDARQKELDLTKSRFAGGINTELDVQLAEAELAAAQSQLDSLQQNRAETEHAIAVLVGVPPEGFSIAANGSKLSPPSVPAGLPSDLLERRPDVAAAERRVAAQNAQIGVAIAAYYPVVRLTGYSGLDSGDISTLVNWQSRVWSLGPNITLPIFEGGQISANVRLQRSTYEENVANYRQQVLVAFRDVEDSLSDLRYLAQQEEAQNRAYQAYAKTLELTIERYKTGLVSYFDVTTAEGDELNAQQTLVQIRGQRMNSTVRLIKALGGGWNDEPPLFGADARHADPNPKGVSIGSDTMP